MIPAVLLARLPWLRLLPHIIGGLALLGLSLALVFAKADVRHWKKQADQFQKLRLADQEAMRLATYQAAYRAFLNIRRANAQRAVIDERTIHALTDDRTRAVAGFERLRQQATAYRSAPRNPDLSAERDATCRAYAGTACDEIPARLKAAQDNTDQLLRWIDWGRAQAAVETVAPVADMLTDPGTAEK